MSNNKNIILAALGGLVAGAVTGLLLAPEKGKQTRDRISRSARSVSDSVTGGINTSVEKVSEISRGVSGLFNRTTSEPAGTKTSSNGNTAKSATKTSTSTKS